MRDTFTTISVDPDLLPQVLREILAMATDPNYVEVTDAEHGRVILAHPELAEAWYQQALAKQAAANLEAEGLLAYVSNFEQEDTEDTTVVAIETIEASNIADSQSLEEPIKRGPGRPRKVVAASASNGEEP